MSVDQTQTEKPKKRGICHKCHQEYYASVRYPHDDLCPHCLGHSGGKVSGERKRNGTTGFQEPKAFTPGKIPAILYALNKYKDLYDGLVIMGAEHVDEILEELKDLGKNKVAAFDIRQEALDALPKYVVQIRGNWTKLFDMMKVLRVALDYNAVYWNGNGKLIDVQYILEFTKFCRLVIGVLNSRGKTSPLKEAQKLLPENRHGNPEVRYLHCGKGVYIVIVAKRGEMNAEGHQEN